MIILKPILKTQDVREWTDFSGVTEAASCKPGNRPSGSLKTPVGL
jgi:hypothetical protein